MINMKYTTIPVFAMVLVLAACSSNTKNLEKRIVKLENKVEELSRKVNGGNSNNQSRNNAPNVQQEKRMPGANNKPDIQQQQQKKAQSVPDGPTPEIAFEQKSHDFGTITAGEKVRHTFAFKNTGKGPLVIKNASASCGCTVPHWPKEPIEPGKSGKIEVEFDSKGKSGQQRKTVTISANTQPEVTKLSIKASVQKKKAGEADASGQENQ